MQDKIIQWFGKEKYTSNLDNIRSFWNGQGKFIVSINSSKNIYRQIYDLDKATNKAVDNLKHQSKLPGTNIPAVFADFGTVSTAKYWKGNVCFDSGNNNIFIEPVAETVKDALSIEPLDIEDTNMDAYQSIRLFKKVSQILNTNNLWLRPSDLQGVLNTAGLIVKQEELLIAMYSEPANVHKFLDKICNLLIEYIRYLRKETKNKIAGNIWPYTFFPNAVAITEDMMPLLSPEMYLEFGIPYLKKMSNCMGPLQIHCCGQWGRHVKNLKKAELEIKAVEFHYPFTKFEEVAPLAQNGAVLIPYIMLEHDQNNYKTQTEYFRDLLKNTDKRYRFWFAFPEDTDEAISFAKEFSNAV